jgi:hypothetical protein
MFLSFILRPSVHHVLKWVLKYFLKLGGLKILCFMSMKCINLITISLTNGNASKVRHFVWLMNTRLNDECQVLNTDTISYFFEITVFYHESYRYITFPYLGCVYAGHLYTQGQTWKDGCKFRCQCVEGATGKYQCTQL